MENESWQFENHAVVFHLDEEGEDAERFCERLKSLHLAKGGTLKVKTLEDLSRPNLQEIEIINQAINKSNFVLCSRAYRAEYKHHFFKNAALQAKIPNRFIFLNNGDKHAGSLESDPSLKSLKGCNITANWEFKSQRDLKKLADLLAGEDTVLLPADETLKKEAWQGSGVPRETPANSLPCDDLDTDATPVYREPDSSGYASEQVSDRPASSSVPAAASQLVSHELERKDTPQFSVLLHAPEEREQAEEFCSFVEKRVSEKGLLATLKTFHSVTHPGKQEIENFNSAVRNSEFVLCTENFREGDLGRFFANAALSHKIDGCFIGLYESKKELNSACGNVCMNSLAGFQLHKDINGRWEFDVTTDLTKLLDIIGKPQKQENSRKLQGSVRPRRVVQEPPPMATVSPFNTETEEEREDRLLRESLL